MQRLAHQSAAAPNAESHGLGEAPHPGSGYSTAYDSPGSSHWEQDGMSAEGNHNYPPPRNMPGYDWAGHPESAYSQPYGYHGMQPRPYGQGSPPPPAISDRSGRTSRAGKTPNLSKPTRESRPKKSAKPKEKPKAQALPGPITALGKESKIKLFDIEKYIHRGIDERRSEVAANSGKIKRPMNSYIMYRKVYQERVKEYSKESNHQTISRLVSSSWEQESTELREKFAEYAQVERENLMKAHPGYKFQPKSKMPKKRKGDGLSDDEPSDLDDSDGEWGAPKYRRNRAKYARRVDEDPAMLESDIFGSRESSYGPWDDGYQQAAYQGVNPGRPPPVPMNPTSGTSAYYPQMMSHGPPGGGSTLYSDLMGADGLDPLLGGRVSGLPGMHDALLNGSHQVGPMDPMLQEPWSGGAFTSDQFQEYSQYPDFGDQGGLAFHDGQVGGAQQEGQAAGGYQDADIDSLLRASGGR